MCNLISQNQIIDLGNLHCHKLKQIVVTDLVPDFVSTWPTSGWLYLAISRDTLV